MALELLVKASLRPKHCAVHMLNLLAQPTKFGMHESYLYDCVEAVCEESKAQAVEEAAEENGHSRDLCVAVDGSSKSVDIHY